MPFIDVLQLVSDRTGLDIVNDRAALVSLVNQAAKELWELSDLPLCLQEIVVAVDSGQQVTMPGIVADVRGIREMDTMMKIDAISMNSRYSVKPWKETWNSWRVKGISPVATQPQSSGPVTYKVPFSENTDAVITIVGTNDNSQRITETLALQRFFDEAVTEINGTVNFDTFISISQNKTHSYNTSIKDIDGDVIAVLGNNERKTQYQVFDLSSYPWRTTTEERYVEILFKPRLYPLALDEDEFPAPEMEGALYHKALEIWSSRQPTKEGVAQAMAYRMKCGALIEARRRSVEGGTQNSIKFARSPYLGLFQHGLYTKRFQRWDEFTV